MADGEAHPASRSGSVAVVIPAYNEAATIAVLVAQCRALADAPRTIVVDDGSRDATAAIAEAAGAEMLRNGNNLGKGASLVRGMQAALSAGATRIVTLDGDGQHRPQDIPRLLACSAAFPDHIVIGSRRASGRAAPRARFIANRVADFWISWAASYPIDDSQSGFRIYPAALLRCLLPRPGLPHGFSFESEILIEAGRLGVRSVAVDIPTMYGSVLQRPSHFRPVADITLIVGMVAGKLLPRAMAPHALWRALTLPRLHHPAPDGPC